jgi:F-type H+-transporting ATPase subunit delta
MAESITVARPYTKAIFTTALVQGDLGTWSAFLSQAATVVTVQIMQQVLAQPALPNMAKAQLVIDICTIEPTIYEQVQRFIKLLATNKRLLLLPAIANLFETMKAEQEKTVDVSITSAFPLGSDQREKLAQAISAKLSRDVNINVTTDASLLGGAIIHVSNLVVDGSVRGKLGKLADALNA